MVDLLTPISVLADYPLSVVDFCSVSWKPTRAVSWVNAREGEYALKAIFDTAAREGLVTRPPRGRNVTYHYMPVWSRWEWVASR